MVICVCNTNILKIIAYNIRIMTPDFVLQYSKHSGGEPND